MVFNGIVRGNQFAGVKINICFHFYVKNIRIGDYEILSRLFMLCRNSVFLLSLPLIMCINKLSVFF